jgi:hypothetical protein
MHDSIFGSRGFTPSTVWDGPREIAKPAPPPRPLSSEKDAALIAILEAPLEFGETAQFGFARKEAELRTAFAALTVVEARALQMRLANPRNGDQLAAAFMRMTRDRRERLINFLADARRREAFAAARR